VGKRSSDEDFTSPKKEKDKKGLTRMASMPVDDVKKPSPIKTKFSEKSVETSLEKYGKDDSKKSSSALFSKKTASPVAKEEIKFDKKQSKTGRLESFGVDLSEQVARENELYGGGSPNSKGKGASDSNAATPNPSAINPYDNSEFNYRQIPRVVLLCTMAIEKRGIDRVGIYRLSGAQSKINRLQLAFMNGHEPDLLSDESEHDVVTISGVLKNYFRELPKSIFPQKLYNDFISIPRLDLNSSSVQEQLKLKQKQITDMRAALGKIPKPNLHTIAHILRHLKLVASNNDVNKMTVDNLSLLFGPSMLGGKDNSVFDMPLQSGVLQFLIHNYNNVFVDDLDVKLNKSS